MYCAKRREGVEARGPRLALVRCCFVGLPPVYVICRGWDLRAYPFRVDASGWLGKVVSRSYTLGYLLRSARVMLREGL
jgi:hypothetical protein